MASTSNMPWVEKYRPNHILAVGLSPSLIATYNPMFSKFQRLKYHMKETGFTHKRICDRWSWLIPPNMWSSG
ncbi:hypothetical protein TB1_037372 [Malus domestica]